MSILTEISGANEYKGSAEIGGSAAAHIEIETKPIQDLAAYTYYYNKSEHEQRQKDADEKIKQLAELTAFDPNTALEGDKKYALQALEDLRKQGKDYATQTNASASDKVKQAWDFNQKIGAAQKRITSINGRAIAYNKLMDEIDNSTLPEGQKELQRADVRKAAKTSVDTPISAISAFDQKIGDPKAVVPTKVEVSSDLNNTLVSHKIDVVTSAGLMQQAGAESINLEGQFSGSHGDFFKASDNPFAIYHNSAEALQVALKDPKYQKKDGNGNIIRDASGNPAIDYELIRQTNPVVGKVLDLNDKYNAWATDMKNQATLGVFKDRLGKEYKSIQGVSAKDFYTFDPKNLTGDNLIALYKWEKAPSLISTAEDAKYTGKSVTLRGQQLDYSAKMAKETSQAPLVEQPLLLFEKHVATLQDKFNTPEFKGKDFIVVPYELTDETTKKVLGIGGDGKVKYDDNGNQIPATTADHAHSYVSYKRDGTAMIGADKNGQGGTPLTIEQQKGKFIDAVKGGNKDAALDAKFLGDAENGFRQKFGTTDGQAIWNSFKGKQQESVSYSVKGKAYSKADLNKLGYTDEQIDQAIQLGNIKTK